MKKLPNPISTPNDASAAGEGYLDKVAVAKRLGVRPKTVGEWAKQGRLPAYRIGPRLRFKWAEVEAHIAATCRVETGQMLKAETPISRMNGRLAVPQERRGHASGQEKAAGTQRPAAQKNQTKINTKQKPQEKK